MCQQLTRLAAPSVGGVLLGLGGVPLTADALSFLVVVVLLAAVRPPYELAPTAWVLGSLVVLIAVRH